MGRSNRGRNEPLSGEALASGNIAHVLRQARASLKDPSRPYTPVGTRLRSTESLFGEGGFRPTISDSGNAQATSSDDYRRRSGLSRRRRPRAGEVPRLKKQPGKGRQKKHAASSSCSGEATTRTEIPRIPMAHDTRGSTTAALEASRPRTEGTRVSSIIDHGSPAGHPCKPSSPSPSSPTNDEGILYLDQGRPRGARSRSIVNQWDARRYRATSTSASSSASSRCSSRSKCLRNSNKMTVDTTRKLCVFSFNAEDGEYEGLYASDVDVDTAAWDLGSVCSGGDGGSSELDFVLHAIDNEVDLGVSVAGPPGRDLACADGEGSGRDASPDPGTLEAKRERNTRLAGLLQMLRDTFYCATNEKPKGSPSDGLGEESRISTMSPASTTRALRVLQRVVERPPGPEDASPPSIAELPALLAARLIVGLVSPSLLSASSACGPDRCPGASRASGDGGRTDHRGEREQLLVAACRHMFEVSKRPGADQALVSSGTLEGLVAFVGFAASSLDSIASGEDVVRERDGEARILCVGASRRRNQSVHAADGGHDNSPASCSRSSIGIASDRDMRREHTEEGNTEDRGGGTDGTLGGVCDSLTFALGCLKNLSAGEGIQGRFLRAGTVQTLCRLVRSTRDLCRRCKCMDGQTGGARVSNWAFFADAQGKAADLFDCSFAGSCGGQLGSGREEKGREDTACPLCKLVSSFLAQAIGLLRDLVAGEQGANKICQAAGGVVGTLCSILRPFRRYQDVVLNAARVLARLSLQERTRAEINSDASHVRDLLAALNEQGRGIEGIFASLKESYRPSSRDASSLTAVPVEHQRAWEPHEKRLAACVRIAFALGNLTSTSDENRRLIGVRLGGAESLPALLLACARAHIYGWERLCAVDGRHTTAASLDGVAEGAREPPFHGERWARTTLRRTCDGLEELLVKTVRLLANISIHREVGQRVCRQPGLVVLEPLLEKCLELFGLFEDGSLPQQLDGRSRSRGSERHKSMVPGEEVLLNAVSLVTNLSFYGPGLNNSPAPPPDGASFDESTAMARSPAGSIGDSLGDRWDPDASLSSAGALASHASVLFALAGKARIGLDEQHPALGTPLAVRSIAVSPSRQVRSAHRQVGGIPPAGTSHPSRDSIVTGVAGDNQGAGSRRREVLTGHLVKVLLHPNVEAVAEAARAFGNFSRDASCRAAISERRGDEVLVALLGHPCREVVFAAAGAVVNLAGDRACRVRLSRQGVGAGERLARLVRRAGLADPGMAELACQALHNLLMVEESPLGGGRGEAVRDVLGGPEAHKKLWWTLKELTDACSSCEGQSNLGQHDGECSRELGGFMAAAKAVWGAMEDGSVDCEPNDSLYEEL
ncbi:unnamed protein product [Scytosiphon promiscuus]